MDCLVSVFLYWSRKVNIQELLHVSLDIFSEKRVSIAHTLIPRKSILFLGW